MSIVFIENVLGSGQIVTIAETFNRQTVQRNLKPGESARFVTSAFKSLMVNECSMESKSSEGAYSHAPSLDRPPYTPIKLTMIS